ncbi:MAG: HD domain-containing protein [Planctomycetaceae bacterium]|nr:HD domain-containing protein [Planctomycetaceae bacterium]
MLTDPARILIVSSGTFLARFTPGLMPSLRSDIVVACGLEQGLAALDASAFDVLALDLALQARTRLRLIKRAAAQKQRPRVIVIGGTDTGQDLVGAFAMGACGYVKAPLSLGDLLAAAARALGAEAAPQWPCATCRHHAEHDQRKISLEAIEALVSAVEAKDPYTTMHSRQVSQYAVIMAGELKLPQRMIESISIAALIHDVGKIGVSDRVLTKPGPLNAAETLHIRRHPVLGEAIVRNLSSFHAEARILRHHHENWDGSGYPDGLKGRQIPQASRIIRLADSLDAMLTARSYRAAIPLGELLEEISSGSGKQFEPELVALTIAWCMKNRRQLEQAQQQARPAAAG